MLWFNHKSKKERPPAKTDGKGSVAGGGRSVAGGKRSATGGSRSAAGSKKSASSVRSLLTHPVLGEVVVVRSARAVRVSVSVRPSGEIRLTVPLRADADHALEFLNSKQQWVLGALERIKKSHPPVVVVPPYSTRSHALVLEETQLQGVKTKVGGGIVRVSYPAGDDPRSPAIQTAIKRGVEQAWRIEAKELLPKRVEELSRLTGLHHRSVAVRNTVSRWGSCSPRDDISLSLHLMRLPDHLIDYIIVHELCHTVHRNHGPHFHALLDLHTGGRHRELRRELSKYHTRW